ncbi:uncharacterized protein LOC135481991 [Liolophura sinensis]|uniref:uncharacterized protein LOC135481991 n=1 Tax=Liolophura sinensis TaxID=3198878 RepID=UPI003158871F
MEVQNPSYYNQSYATTTNCYSSHTFRDCGNDRGQVSQRFNSSSFLPPILDGVLHSKRTERFTPSVQKDKPKILRPSKHGYHRRGNSPTFKLLAEVSEKLQVLVDRQTIKKVVTSGNNASGEDDADLSVEYFGDCSSSPGDEQGCVSPPCSNGGTMLELNDYSSDISSPGSIILTPILPVRHFSTSRTNVQLHFYLPQLTETTDREQSSQELPWSTTNDNSENTRSQDYADFYDVRPCCVEDEEERKSCDYKRTSTTYSKSTSKSGHRKSKSKKSKAPKGSVKKQISDSQRSVFPNISRDIIVSGNDKGLLTEQIDLLNDVTTLISEQKDLLPFPEASYKLPDLFQNGSIPQDESDESSRCFSFSHRLSCYPTNVDPSKGLNSKSDCPICKYKIPSPKKFVDRLSDIDNADTDDLNNNNKSLELLSWVSKC